MFHALSDSSRLAEPFDMALPTVVPHLRVLEDRGDRHVRKRGTRRRRVMRERSQTHATFVLERYSPVPVERVWDAFADPEMKRQWFGSGDFVERERREDFCVGGVARSMWHTPPSRHHVKVDERTDRRTRGRHSHGRVGERCRPDSCRHLHTTSEARPRRAFADADPDRDQRSHADCCPTMPSRSTI